VNTLGIAVLLALSAYDAKRRPPTKGPAATGVRSSAYIENESTNRSSRSGESC
jgi:hypothetical protein